ncbi:MAG: ribonuclease P protein component 4 [Nanoarchaeota archaeon]
MAKRSIGRRFNIRQKQYEEALSHINELHAEQNRRLYSQTHLAQRYSDIIRRIAMKFRLRLPRVIKHSYCKHCKTVFAPGKNCRFRLRNGRQVIYCFKCKRYTRLPYSGK